MCQCHLEVTNHWCSSGKGSDIRVVKLGTVKQCAEVFLKVF